MEIENMNKVDNSILIEMYERAKDEQSDCLYVNGQLYSKAFNNEYVKVWIDGTKFYCESADDLIEQYVRYVEFKDRVSKMKTYADYLG